MFRVTGYCNRVWTTYSISKQFPNCFQGKADAYMEAIPPFNLFIWRLGNITVLRKLDLRMANSLENSLLHIHLDPRWRFHYSNTERWLCKALLYDILAPLHGPDYWSRNVCEDKNSANNALWKWATEIPWGFKTVWKLIKMWNRSGEELDYLRRGSVSRMETKDGHMKRSCLVKKRIEMLDFTQDWNILTLYDTLCETKCLI